MFKESEWIRRIMHCIFEHTVYIITIIYRLRINKRSWIGFTKIYWSVGLYWLHDLLILRIHQRLTRLGFLLYRTADYWRWWKLEPNVDIIGFHLRHTVHQANHRVRTLCACNHMRFQTNDLDHDGWIALETYDLQGFLIVNSKIVWIK